MESAPRGSARIERLPSARGPTSLRPWNQPMILPSAIAAAVFVIGSRRSYCRPASVSAFFMSDSVQDGPRKMYSPLGRG